MNRRRTEKARRHLSFELRYLGEARFDARVVGMRHHAREIDERAKVARLGGEQLSVELAQVGGTFFGERIGQNPEIARMSALR